jgi:iron complex outermembrane receptor protein
VNKFYGTDIGRYYLSYAGLDSNLYNDVAFGSEDGLYALAATTVVEYDNHYEKTDIIAQISDVFELPGGPVDIVVGYEGFDNNYSAQYDKHSEGGLVGGSAGNSGAGTRAVDSYFGEILLPVMAGVELNAAIRSDDYDDVGSNDSFKVGVLWEGKRGTMVKFNVGEGFRAPTMDTLYGVTTFSANTATDYLACANAGISQSACASKQVSTLITSNPNLGAESSDSTTFSISQDMGELTPALNNLSLRLDWFNIEMEDLISSVSTQDVLYSDFTNGNLLTGNYEYYDATGLKGDGSAAGAPVGTGTSATCPSNATYYKRLGVSPALYTIRSCANGRVDYVGASYANQGKYEVEGYDIFVDYTVELGGGDLDVTLEYSHIEDYGGAPFIGSDAHQNNAGFNGLPENRYNLILNYTWGDYGIGVTNRHIGDFAFNSNCASQEAGGLCTKEGPYQDKYDTIDIQARANFGKYGTISIGVINASDKDPLADKGGVNYDAYTGLYDNRGKITYVRWKISL